MSPFPFLLKRTAKCSINTISQQPCTFSKIDTFWIWYQGSAGQGCINCAILPSGMRARKFGAHGEHGDVFLFSNLGALWFSENLIRYSLHVCLGEVKNNLFFLQKLLFTAFLVTILKILTYALVSTWSSVSSRYEHVPQLMQPWGLLPLLKDWIKERDQLNFLFWSHYSIVIQMCDPEKWILVIYIMI